MENHTKIAAFLQGRLAYRELTKAQQSALQLPVYHRAKELLNMPPDKRKEAGMTLHPELRDLVRDEFKRLVEMRKAG